MVSVPSLSLGFPVAWNYCVRVCVPVLALYVVEHVGVQFLHASFYPRRFTCAESIIPPKHARSLAL